MPGERKDYLTWDEYFMSLAIITAERSKDPKTQVGACIVNKDNHILSLGYNGAVLGLDDHLDMPWHSLGENTNDIMQIKNTFVCHAEANAIDNFSGDKKQLEGATIYVTLFPCLECTKRIIMNKLKRVVFLDMYSKQDQTIASMYMFKHANVTVEKYQNIQSLEMVGHKIIQKTKKLY